MIIKVPGSSANLGPGFDVFGIALSLYLELRVSLSSSNQLEFVTLAGLSVPLEHNLILKTAEYVAIKCATTLPSNLRIECFNHIPLGAGLGSSGSAVVAGVLLANWACKLNLSKSKMLDFCLCIEDHPDNIAPSLLGGFTASFVDSTALSTPNSDSAVELHSLATHLEHFVTLDSPPVVRYVPLPISPKIKAIAVTPNFPLPTKESRNVLPTSYSRSDIVFNLQRVAVMTQLLADPTPETATTVFACMQDKIHQPFRAGLVPGLVDILKLSPKECPGLLGVCLSGAGPTILAFAIDSFEDIGARMKSIFQSHNLPNGNPIQAEVRVLEIDMTGAQFIE